MSWFIIKVLLTAVIIVAVSEIGKVNAFMGSILASIPLVSTLGMIWMHAEKTPSAKIIAHSRGVFWMVLPSCEIRLRLVCLLIIEPKGTPTRADAGEWPNHQALSRFK